MKKILAITLTLLLMFSSVAYAAAKWNGYDIKSIYSGGKEVKSATPAIVVKGQTFVPVSMLRQFGLTVSSDAKGVKVELPKPVEAPTKVTYALTPYMLELISQSVYKVLGSTDDPKIAKQGTGFLVGSVMITNAHVSGDSAFTQVTVDGMGQKITKYKFVNKDTDLMGFEVVGGKSLPVSVELPRAGDVVYTIGYPHGELKVTEGVVTSIKVFGGVSYIYHNAPLDSGGSGSPLLNGKGEVIGVNKGSTIYQNEYSVSAVPTSSLMNELK